MDKTIQEKIREIKEKVLVYMMNQIPSKYYSNPDKIKEFGDIIEETITQCLSQVKEAIDKLFG